MTIAPSENRTISVDGTCCWAKSKNGQAPATRSTEDTLSSLTVASIRPLLPSEQRDGYCSVLTATANRIQVAGSSFQLDAVFHNAPGQMGTANVYQHCVQPHVDSLFEGYSATVFTYGQTGSGKTQTMGLHSNCTTQGIVPQAMIDILRHIAAHKAARYALHATAVEVYMNEIKDLLTSDPVMQVKIREVPGSKAVELQGAVSHRISSLDDVRDLIQLVAAKRQAAGNAVHHKSSRSHAVVSLSLQQLPHMKTKPGLDAVSTGSSDQQLLGQRPGPAEFVAQLQLVDLAGAETSKQAADDPTRERQRHAINGDLHVLKRVIDAVVAKDKHVPYRDSTLTRLLSYSLGGSARTIMVACLSPAINCEQETKRTLAFAAKARSMVNKPQINMKPAAIQTLELQQLVDRQQQQIWRLECEIMALKAIDNRMGEYGNDLCCAADEHHDEAVCIPDSVGVRGSDSLSSEEATFSPQGPGQEGQAELLAKLETARAQIWSMSSQIQHLEQHVQGLDASADQAAGTIAALTAQVALLQHQLAEQQEATAAAAAEHRQQQQIETARHTVQLQQEIHALDVTANEAVDAFASIMLMVAYLQCQLADAKAAARQQQQQLEAATAHQIAVQQQQLTLARETAALKAQQQQQQQLCEAAQQLAEARQAADAAAAAAEQYQQELLAATATTAALRAELEATKTAAALDAEQQRREPLAAQNEQLHRLEAAAAAAADAQQQQLLQELKSEAASQAAKAEAEAAKAEARSLQEQLSNLRATAARQTKTQRDHTQHLQQQCKQLQRKVIRYEALTAKLHQQVQETAATVPHSAQGVAALQQAAVLQKQLWHATTELQHHRQENDQLQGQWLSSERVIYEYKRQIGELQGQCQQLQQQVAASEKANVGLRQLAKRG